MLVGIYGYSISHESKEIHINGTNTLYEYYNGSKHQIGQSTPVSVLAVSYGNGGSLKLKNNTNITNLNYSIKNYIFIYKARLGDNSSKYNLISKLEMNGTNVSLNLSPGYYLIKIVTDIIINGKYAPGLVYGHISGSNKFNLRLPPDSLFLELMEILAIPAVISGFSGIYLFLKNNKTL